MYDNIMAGVIVFGILFAICMIGLFASNAAAERMSGRRSTAAFDGQRSAMGTPMTAQT